MNKIRLQELLDYKADQYNNRDFIEDRPVSIPHWFQKLQDIEISGFFAALLAQGDLAKSVGSCGQLLDMMGRSPYDFVLHYSPQDIKPIFSFSYLTINSADILYFISFFHTYYSTFLSLESAFGNHLEPQDLNVKKALTGFRRIVFAGNPFEHAKEHLPSPAGNSACRQMNMFLRWMVQSDHRGVAFGLWKTISPSQLVIPLDVSKVRVARRLGLIDRRGVTWENTERLTDALRLFDPKDPVRYVYALMGLEDEFSLAGRAVER